MMDGPVDDRGPDRAVDCPSDRRGGQMIQRWVASALLEAEKRFRRVRGYRELQHWSVVPWTRWLCQTAWSLTWRNLT